MESSKSGGVKVMSIGSRMTTEKERLIGMTEEERAWRARFLKSQELSPEEPLNTKEYYRAVYNPIRRFYRFPLNCFENALVPLVGQTPASAIRYTIAKTIMTLIVMYGGWYYFKYNYYTWEQKCGWKASPTRERTLPGTADYKGLPKPLLATYGFENSPI
ncbi:unnamed protein product [Xylocopa violacea]|uniref:NADH dehydrogenase [ubiquinone] 1 beta subcomplex subunit 6 n=1 Tax=Xylocopa violacea TaxID=135666 RepID=A0ABP1NXS7_XYLVO